MRARLLWAWDWLRFWRRRRGVEELREAYSDQMRAEQDRGYPHTWQRSALPPRRKGQRCRKTGRKVTGGVAGVCEVEFPDGRRFIVQEAGLGRG